MYSKIVNPKTGRKVSIFGKLGKKILKNYLEIVRDNILKGGSTNYNDKLSYDEDDNSWRIEKEDLTFARIISVYNEHVEDIQYQIPDFSLSEPDDWGRQADARRLGKGGFGSIMICNNPNFIVKIEEITEGNTEQMWRNSLAYHKNTSDLTIGPEIISLEYLDSPIIVDDKIWGFIVMKKYTPLEKWQLVRNSYYYDQIDEKLEIMICQGRIACFDVRVDQMLVDYNECLAPGKCKLVITDYGGNYCTQIPDDEDYKAVGFALMRILFYAVCKVTHPQLIGDTKALDIEINPNKIVKIINFFIDNTRILLTYNNVGNLNQRLFDVNREQFIELCLRTAQIWKTEAITDRARLAELFANKDNWLGIEH